MGNNQFLPIINSIKVLFGFIVYRMFLTHRPVWKKKKTKLCCKTITAPQLLQIMIQTSFWFVWLPLLLGATSVLGKALLKLKSWGVILPCLRIHVFPRAWSRRNLQSWQLKFRCPATCQWCLFEHRLLGFFQSLQIWCLTRWLRFGWLSVYW